MHIFSAFVPISHELDLHYLRSGDGPQPVVLVPGWTMSADVFIRQLRFLAKSSSVTAYALDPRSHGRSTKTPSGNTWAQRGRDLHEFLRRLNLRDVVLLGWSYGVYDVLSFVEQFGTRGISGVVLVDCPPRCSTTDPTTDWAWFRRDDGDHFLESYTTGVLNDRVRLTRSFAESMVGSHDGRHIDWITSMSYGTPAEVAALLNETAAYLDFTTTVQQLRRRIPLLFVVRADSAALARSWVGEHAFGAELLAFGGHMMFWESAARFNRALAAFCVRASIRSRPRPRRKQSLRRLTRGRTAGQV